MASDADSDIKNAIKDAAADGIQSATDDATSVTNMNVKDQIAADKYVGSNDAVDKNPNRGIRFNKVKPGNDW